MAASVTRCRAVIVFHVVVIVISTLPAGLPQARRPGVDFPAPGYHHGTISALPAGPTTGTGLAADAGGMAPIQIQGLVKRYGPVTAVDNLSFEVQPGTVTGFLGPNGAGKTTTLRMLLGLVTPDAGSATINGRRYTELAEPLHQVGAVLEASFHPGRTARAQLRIQALSADADPSRADDVLRPGRAGRRGGPPGRRILARHAAAARPGDRAPGRPDC